MCLEVIEKSVCSVSMTGLSSTELNYVTRTPRRILFQATLQVAVKAPRIKTSATSVARTSDIPGTGTINNVCVT